MASVSAVLIADVIEFPIDSVSWYDSAPGTVVHRTTYVLPAEDWLGTESTGGVRSVHDGGCATTTKLPSVDRSDGQLPPNTASTDH